MNQLNQITQQNASASEELAATAEEMSGQVERLQQLMAFFKVDTSATPVTQAPGAARTAPKKAAHASQSSQKVAAGGGEPGFVKF
jgi:methyl-accepting chemotaxis protein